MASRAAPGRAGVHLAKVLLVLLAWTTPAHGASTQVTPPTVSAFARPRLTTVGVPLRDNATVHGLLGGGDGTVTFRLYSDAMCTVEVFTSTRPLGEASTAVSEPYAAPVPGTYRWVARYNGDAANSPSAPTACNDPLQTVVVASGGAYVSLTPSRTEDTRLGLGGLSGPLGSGATAQVQISGRGGVPAAGVSAVILNVTVTEPSGDGYLTLYPSGSPRPVASNLNFTVGKTVPNLVVVKVGTEGNVAVFNSSGDTHVIFDVVGYYTDAPRGGAGQYFLQDTVRIADSRLNTGGAVRLGPGASVEIPVAGRVSVPPSGAVGVVLNVAATGTTAASYMTVYPSGEPRPVASNLNFTAGDTVSNRVMTKLGMGGAITIYNHAGSTDLVVDLNGWYTGASNSGVVGMFAPTDPVRILDTRLGVGGVFGPLEPSGTVQVQITGRGGLPARDIRAVVLNVTVTEPAMPGYLTLYRSGGTQPTTSDLNFAAGEIRPNLVVVRVGGDDGKVRLFTSGQTHVIVDVAGYFA